MTPKTAVLLRRHAARFVALVLALALGGLMLAASGSAKPNSRSRSDHGRRGHVQPPSGTRATAGSRRGQPVRCRPALQPL